MKIYNNLSICALAGLLAFTSCTKEESLDNGSTAQTFQISVSDMGFQGISDGRAIDENFKTTFVKGDAIGMYGVENGQLEREFPIVNLLSMKGSMGFEWKPYRV